MQLSVPRPVTRGTHPNLGFRAIRQPDSVFGPCTSGTTDAQVVPMSAFLRRPSPALNLRQSQLTLMSGFFGNDPVDGRQCIFRGDPAHAVRGFGIVQPAAGQGVVASAPGELPGSASIHGALFS